MTKVASSMQRGTKLEIVVCCSSWWHFLVTAWLCKKNSKCPTIVLALLNVKFLAKVDVKTNSDRFEWVVLIL